MFDMLIRIKLTADLEKDGLYMRCDICKKKKATVHLTEIVDEQMTEMHLCEDCAHEKSAQMEQQFGLADLLAGLSDFGKKVKDIDKVKTRCPNCGMSYDEFRKFGRLGCGQCYESFKMHLTTLLKRIHGSNQHLGKAPVMIMQGKPDEGGGGDLAELRKRLLDAVKAENFELAAELRDRIRDIEKTQKK